MGNWQALEQSGDLKDRFVLRVPGHIKIFTRIILIAYVDVTGPERIYKPRCLYVAYIE
jgi:hypothetical protein